MSESLYLDGIGMAAVPIGVSKVLVQGVFKMTEPISSIKDLECLNPSEFGGGSEHAVSVIA